MRELDPAQVYGHRPQRADIWCLSPYEFTMYWDVVPMKMPQTRSDWTSQPSTHWDVEVTATGTAKLAAAKSDTANVRLLPGVDFKRKEKQETSNKVFFGGNGGNALRHGWFLQRRLRPLCPHLATSPTPSKWGDDAEHNAKLTMAYFRAWTLDKKRGNEVVPHIRQLRSAEVSWEQSLRIWLLNLPCEETKRYVGNFLAVYRVRPEMEAENSDDEDDTDDLFVSAAKLPEACNTHIAKAEEQSGKGKGKWSCHRTLVVEAIQRAELYWKASARHCRDVPNPYAEADDGRILKGLRRKKKDNVRPMESEAPATPEVTSEIIDLAKIRDRVAEWVKDVKERCNAEQASFCKTIAQQALAQLRGEEAATNEPLRWALHGGPGTGKSYTLNLMRKELFEGVLGWRQGSEFQIVTLQAVMANDLDGDTIHHAFGLNWQGGGDERISGHKLLELSAKAIAWRWLILDEISMVSAELLARLELRCRELVRDLSDSKYAQDSALVRPFGGLNVILAGDLWQLPPPRGTFLGDVPWEMLTHGKSKKVAHAARGQQLVWGAPPDGVHGITELVQCERTHDVWLQKLQGELRSGKLSEANHAFLHGRDTCVPGSWNGEWLECGNGACQALLDAKACKEKMRRWECKTCQKERRSKERVVGEATAKPEGFANAKAIFATNAVKYHVNKLRAKEWAASHVQQVYYAIAKDRISSRALREKARPRQGQNWRGCNGMIKTAEPCTGFCLYALAMPVMATDHLDRDRGILRGCPGEVVGWKLGAKDNGEAGDGTCIWNKLPACIFVRFQTKTLWRVDGLSEDNVFSCGTATKTMVFGQRSR